MRLCYQGLRASLVALLLHLSFLECHVLNYDSVTVCDGMAKQIQCPNDENIHVLQGFYGKWRNHDCKGESDALDNSPTCSIDRKKTTEVAREICQGQNTCKLISDKAIFGEPCLKGKPYLYVTFFCMAQGQKLHHQRTETNEEVVTVPSHGFVVEEIHNVNLNDNKPRDEQSKKKTNLPLENPSPENRKSDESEILHPTVNKKVDAEKTVVHDKKNVTLAKLINKDKISSELEKLGGKPAPIINKKDESSFQKENDDKKNEKDNVKSNAVSANGELKELKELKELTLKNITKANAENSPGRKKDEIDVEKSKTNKESNNLVTKLKEGDSVTKSDLPSASSTDRSKKESDGKLRSSTICNGQSKLIACLPEEGIKINYAFYGKKSGRDCRGPLPYKDESPSCSALDAKSNVKSSCDGKQTCLLFADDNIYGKSLCPNVNKYLYLTYTCGLLPVKEIAPAKHVEFTPQEDLEEDAVSRSTEPTQQFNTTVKVCNGEKRTISCNRETMKIMDAFFGKEIGKDCRGELGYRDDIPECKNPRSLEAIKFLCENRKSCELAGESALFGDDVCPGVNKYLLVTYSC